MTYPILAVILVSVLFSALAQICFKAGVSSEIVQDALSRLGRAAGLWISIKSPFVLIGLALYGISVGGWLLVLARIDVSQAYPFVGLGFILTMAFGAWFLGEDVSPTRIFGTCLVFAGVYFVGRT